MTLEEFVHTENLRWRDQKRGRIIKKILAQEEDMVFVISPISYTDNFSKRIIKDDILPIQLVDTPLITNKFEINNEPPEMAVKRLIMEYGLS